MSFSRINPDVIDLGTTQLSGVTTRMFTSSRDPWDGAVTGATIWNNATNYFVGQRVIHQGYVYEAINNNTNSNPLTNTTNRTQEFGTNWKAIDGKDGDIWFKVDGASSGVLQKTNNAWQTLNSNFSGAPIALVNSATNELAFAYNAASFRSANIDYLIRNATGDIQRGKITAVNDGVNVFANIHDITEMNNDVGIDFNFSISGTDVEVTYNSSPSPIGRLLYYILRS